MHKLLFAAAPLALALASPALPQASADLAAGRTAPSPLSPNEIVTAAPRADWVAIAPSDLLVMDLAPDAKGRPRRVVIQLMPPPFSQGWIGNIRTLASAHWWDGLSVNRVQDNYVVQWGDADGEDAKKAKPLPFGIATVLESSYQVDDETLGSYNSPADPFDLQDQSDTVEVADSTASYAAREAAAAAGDPSIYTNALWERDRIAQVTIDSTRTPNSPAGWHQRDSSAQWVEFWKGWPLANAQKWHWENPQGETIDRPLGVVDEVNTDSIRIVGQNYTRVLDENLFWPVHCYSMVGVGRDMPPNSGTGAELYVVIGHAPRHLDRNIALVGRVIAGIEHLSSLPRGTGALGFYETPEERTGIKAIRLGSEVAGLPAYEYLSTESESFARYADARANRRDPFFIRPAGGADICNIPVPVRKVAG